MKNTIYIVSIIIVNIIVFITNQPTSILAQSISVVPNKGEVGTQITIFGNGFTPNSEFEVIIDDIDIATGETDTNGEFNIDIEIPSTFSPGKLLIKIVCGEISENCYFTLYDPVLDITPSTGIAGTKVVVSGFYFPQNTTIKVSLEGSNVYTGTTDSQGEFSTKISIPDVYSPGRKLISAKANDYSAVIYFEVPDPIVKLDPTSGLIGTSVHISGQYFPPSSKVCVYFEDQVITNGNTDENGNINITTSIPFSYKVGRNSLKVTSGEFGSIQYFEVLPVIISLAPEEGTVDSSIQIDGRGFNEQQKVTLSIDGRILGTINSDKKGSFSYTTKVIPCCAGQHKIIAKDSFGIESSELQFQVFPQISCNDSTTVSVGNQIKVNGNGFAKDASVRLWVEGSSSEQVVQCDSFGSFQNVALKVTNISGGSRKVIATDNSGNKAVSSSVSIISDIENTGNTRVCIDTPFSICGYGFPADMSNMKIYLGGIPVGLASSDSQGNLSFSGLVPEIPGGEYSITIDDNLGKNTSSEWSLSVIASAQIDNTNVYIGQNVNISGNGYLSNKDIQVYWDDIALTLTNIIKSDSHGSFHGSFSIPKSINGIHKIIISDGVFANNFNLQIEQDCPAVPIPLQPKDGKRIGHFWPQTPTFKWSEVQDISGVSYQFVISRNSTFDDMLLAKDTLDNSIYVIQKTEALYKGNYYWRVRAIDDAGNSSEWSSTTKVQIGSVLPYWIGVVGGLFVVLLLVLVRLNFGFTQLQHKNIAIKRLENKEKRIKVQNAKKAHRNEIDEINTRINELAEKNYGILDMQQIVFGLGLDEKLIKECLGYLNIKYEKNKYYFIDIESKYKKHK